MRIALTLSMISILVASPVIAEVDVQPKADGEFLLRVDKAETRTLGDPQVHFGPMFFYWPAKRVCYSFPKKGVEIVGQANSGNGYTNWLMVLKKGKLPVVHSWNYNLPQAQQASTFTIPKTMTIFGYRLPVAAMFRKFIKRGVELLWTGGKVGWHRKDGKLLKWIMRKKDDKARFNHFRSRELH